MIQPPDEQENLKNRIDEDNSIHHPNDSLFKAFMSNPIMAKDFLALQLPKAIYKRIENSKLVLCPQSFVDNKLKHKHVDVLYCTEFDDKIGYIYILTEQQTEPDEMLPFRIMQYVLRIIEHHQKQFDTKEFPVIYPLIYYVGKKPYKFSTDFYDGFGDNKELAKSILTNPFQIANVYGATDEELQAHPLAGALTKVYQIASARDVMTKLSELKPYIVYIDNHGYLGLLLSMLEFILDKAENGNGEKVLEAVTNMVTAKTGENVMTLAQQMKNEAAYEKQHMIAENLLKRGLDLKMISEDTGLDLSELKKMKAKIEETRH